MNRSFTILNKKSLLRVTRPTQHCIRCSLPLSLQRQEQNAPPPPSLPLLATLPATIDVSTTDASLPGFLAVNESILSTIHSAGLPWWATIVTGTLLLRTSLTLPIAIYQQRSLGKMLDLAPMIQSWAETLKVNLGKESARDGWPYEKYNLELQKRYKKKVNAIYSQHGCARWQLLLLPWVQIPLFISMSLTLRHMTSFPLPWLGKTSEIPTMGLEEGGLAWFSDLTAVDPTMVVPVLIGAGNLINVELNAWYARENQSTTQKVMTNAFRVLSVAFVPIAANAPMAIGVYWFTSAWYSVIQNIAFKIPTVRKALKMPLLQPKKVEKE